MNAEREQLLDQNYALDPKIREAIELLKSCRQYVYRATVERDFEAYPILAKLDAFIK